MYSDVTIQNDNYIINIYILNIIWKKKLQLYNNIPSFHIYLMKNVNKIDNNKEFIKIAVYL